MNLEDKILNRIDELLEKGNQVTFNDAVSYADTAEFFSCNH